MSGSTNFHYSFSVLPREERRAIHVVYDFCRKIDDIVDEGPSVAAEDIRKKRDSLNWWRTEIECCYSSAPPSPLLVPLAAVIRRFSIPKQYLLTVIDGCERDLVQRRYKTFDDLKEYCYSVASVVGLICIEIFGYRREETRQYAINLGYALQLTNILRDVKQDKDRGYIYIPQEDLQRFRYTEEDLINEVYDERFQRLMDFQVQRARDFYHKARTMLHPDERLTMVAAEIMDAIYYRLLEKIELNDYRVFQRRIKVNTIHKLITAMRIWIGGKVFVKRLR
ncbi:MAG: presqualene diphosphate synthase HpnD [bacterium]|nr:presqualene diphosphate synthase HpnD [bacterium]